MKSKKKKRWNERCNIYRKEIPSASSSIENWYLWTWVITTQLIQEAIKGRDYKKEISGKGKLHTHVYSVIFSDRLE